MTDPSFDELASAHLDGATTPEEAARVAADPALRARVEELRQVRDAVAALPPVDAARREAAIAAALAAFAEGDAPVERAPVASLTAVAARRGASRRAVQVLGAAAAVAVLALLAPVLGRMGSSSDDEATSFDSTGAAIEGAPEEATEDDGASSRGDDGRDVPTTTSPAEQDLGAFDDLDALVTALSDSPGLLEARGVPFSPTVDGIACPAPSATEQTSAAVTAGARATVADEPVVVILQADGGVRTVLVYRVVDCTLIAERPL